MSSDSDDGVIPQSIADEAKVASLDLLPIKSRERYEKEYYIFKEWQKEKNVDTISEDVLLVYFSQISKKFKSSTLWSKYSMLRTMILLKNNRDIKFPKVITFLRRKNEGYRAKKAKTFSRDDISPSENNRV